MSKTERMTKRRGRGTTEAAHAALDVMLTDAAVGGGRASCVPEPLAKAPGSYVHAG